MDKENDSINSISAIEGIGNACKMLRSQYLAAKAGINNVVLSRCLHGGLNNGKPEYFRADHIENLERAIHEIGSALLLTKIKRGEVAESEQNIAYGVDMIEKFKNLGKVLNLTYLFTGRMGWTDSKRKLRLSVKNDPRYYGVFSDDELNEINRTIHQCALELCSMELIYDNTNNTKIQVMNAKTRKQLAAIKADINSLINKCEELTNQYADFGAEVKAVAARIEAIKTDEQMKLDNMERFEGSEKYNKMEAGVDALDDATSTIDDVSPEDIISALGFCHDYLVNARDELNDCGDPMDIELSDVVDSINEATEP